MIIWPPKDTTLTTDESKAETDTDTEPTKKTANPHYTSENSEQTNESENSFLDNYD